VGHHGLNYTKEGVTYKSVETINLERPIVVRRGSSSTTLTRDP
jgi:hypothetical protein